MESEGNQEGMDSAAGRGKLLIMVLILIAALSIAFFFGAGFISKQPRGLSGTVGSQLAQAVKTEGSYQLALNESSCYWIRPSNDGQNYVVEIRQMNSTENCLGDTLSVQKVISTGPVNYDGGCLCGQSCTIETTKDKDGVLNLKVNSCKKV